MSASSKKSAKKTTSRSTALNRPFAKAVWDRAKDLADQYRIVLESDDELGFIGRGLELPDVYADGPDPEACVRETREALATAVATMIEIGERPPETVSEGKRTTQVNVRFTVHEKMWLEASARQHGFRSLSELLRTAGFALPKILTFYPTETKRKGRTKRLGTVTK